MDGGTSEEIIDLEVVMERELMDCRKKCVDLELGIRKKNSEFECLDLKFKAMAVENNALVEELGVLKKKYDELEKKVTCSENGNNSGEGGSAGMEKENVEDKVLKLIKENHVLECEKKKAESEAEVWKAKCKELESRVLELEGRDKEDNIMKREFRQSQVGIKEMNEVSGLQNKSLVPTCSQDLEAVDDKKETMHTAAGKIKTSQQCVEGTQNHLESGDTLSSGTPGKQCTYNGSGKRGSIPGTETEYVTQVRKQLKYGEGNPTKKMAPSTPGGVRCASVSFIDISDSDDEHDLTLLKLPTSENQEKQTITTVSIGGNLNIKECTSENEIVKALLDQSDDEDMVGDKGSSPVVATRKRKRAFNIVTSDSENEDDLICELKTETQPKSVADFQSNGSPVKATVSGSNIYKAASKRCRRLVNLGNAVSTPKKKVASHCVNSDSRSEDDDDVQISKLMSNSSSVPATVPKNSGSENDDDVPISKLMSNSSPATVSRNSGSEDNVDVPLSKLMQNSSSVPAIVSKNRITRAVSRRRLQSLRKFERNGLRKSSNNCNDKDTRKINCYPGTSSEDDGEDAIREDNELESEGESLGGFIVDGSDISENSDSDDALSIKSETKNSLSRNSDHGKASGDSEYASGDDIDFGEIISTIGRNRDYRKVKWELEADMLADFGKDPELCMKAVCALYRQQTSDEKFYKGTLYSNRRGFSQFDAYRGTSLAEFLTNGDPAGDLQKSVDEFEQYNAEGIELCRDLANRYSKQLFTIYKNKEDPFFLPDTDRV